MVPKRERDRRPSGIALRAEYPVWCEQGDKGWTGTKMRIQNSISKVIVGFSIYDLFFIFQIFFFQIIGGRGKH